MAPPTIDYGRMPASCRRDDRVCIEQMTTGSFLMALDYVTSGGSDGTVTADQIKGLLVGGELTQRALQEIGEAFNRRNAPNGLQLGGVPYARDFKEFLRSRHRDVYNYVFGVGEPRPVSTSEARRIVQENLRRLADLLDLGARGTRQTIDQRDYFVDVYLNGFGLKTSLSPIFQDRIGGEGMASECMRLLSEAYRKFAGQRKSDAGPCDRKRPDGSVDVSVCYERTARNLRLLAGFVR